MRLQPMARRFEAWGRALLTIAGDRLPPPRRALVAVGRGNDAGHGRGANVVRRCCPRHADRTRLGDAWSQAAPPCSSHGRLLGFLGGC